MLLVHAAGERTRMAAPGVTHADLRPTSGPRRELDLDGNTGPGDGRPEARADSTRGQEARAERGRVCVDGGSERPGRVVEQCFGDGHGQGDDARQVCAGEQCIHGCLLVLDRV